MDCVCIHIYRYGMYASVPMYARSVYDVVVRLYSAFDFFCAVIDDWVFELSGVERI
jgi:hypothetical protein